MPKCARGVHGTCTAHARHMHGTCTGVQGRARGVHARACTGRVEACMHACWGVQGRARACMHARAAWGV